MSGGAKWVAATIMLGILVLVAAIAASWPLARYVLEPGRQLKTYYIPSESMRPTLEVNDRIMPRAVRPGDRARGTVVLFRLPDQVRVTRIAAIAGDRVAVRDGIVFLNGRPIAQRPVGQPQPAEFGRQEQRLIEQFPGEAKPHLILDSGPTPGDNVAEVTVPAGHLFLLGDNRDNSADSRYPREGYGIGMVPEGDVFGVVDFIPWSPKRGVVARPVDAIDGDGK
jgi:signal peptidase I